MGSIRLIINLFLNLWIITSNCRSNLNEVGKKKKFSLIWVSSYLEIKEAKIKTAQTDPFCDIGYIIYKRTEKETIRRNHP